LTTTFGEAKGNKYGADFTKKFASRIDLLDSCRSDAKRYEDHSSSRSLPPRFNLSFPRLVHLEIFLSSRLGDSPIEIGEVSNSLLAIFKFMPALESLKIICPWNQATRRETIGMQITSLAGKYLKELYIECPIPKGLISTTARNCSHLTKFYTDEISTVHNDDLLGLSQSCPSLRGICIRDAPNITEIGHFTALHKLETLELHYTTGKYLDIGVLLKFATSCPRLNQILLSDWDTMIH